ncbi:MAG: hypothetical protein K6B14_09285 [Lachnospiraceae bacterium]|nr:hypothetical protein [Lachnospiraceae bacterium]
MDTIFKTFSGIFFLMVLMVAGLSFFVASIDAANADSYATSVTNRVRASYFNEDVIKACKSEAEKKNYGLDISVYTDEKTGECYGITDVSYVYRVPVFGISHTFHVTSEMY